MNKNLEFRIADTRLNAVDAESRTIEGRAICFNSESVLLGGEFREVILPEACTQDFIDTQDIRILYNHQANGYSLARHKAGGSGTLEVRVEADGVYIKFDAPKTPFGDEILDGVRRGDIDKMSFCFAVAGENWEKRGDEYLRTITKFALISECSCLDVAPAYDSSTVSCRSLEAFKEELRAAEEPKKDEEEKPAEEPTEPVVEPTPEEPKKEDEEERSTEEPKDEETEPEEEPEEEPKKDEEEEEKPSDDELRAYFANLRSELR